MHSAILWATRAFLFSFGLAAATAAPVITGVRPPPDGIYGESYARNEGDLQLVVNFSEPVTVTGSPSIGVRIGSANQEFRNGFATLSGREVVFSYTLQPGFDGTLSITGPINLNGGTIKGADGEDASLAFTPVEAPGVVIDTVAPATPVISEVTPASPTSEQSFTISGTAEPGSHILFSDAGVGQNADVDASGNWSKTFGPLAPGSYSYGAAARDRAGNESGRAHIVVTVEPAPTGRPIVTQQPASRAAAPGSAVTFTAATSAASPTYQWFYNGALLSGANASSYTVSPVEPARAGVYSATITESGQSTQTAPAILGIDSGAKVIGAGREVGANIVHPNGNVYDQILTEGGAATVTADPGQVTRISFVDLNDDIVQLEFSGAGTLSLVLDAASGPATAKNYNQPDVQYMRGHASIVISGANETTNVAVFSVGRANAVNQSLFRDDVTYDGVADVAFLTILSADGKFGGIRAGNASFWATRGLTGIYAPNVQFSGPVYVGDVMAEAEAQPVLVLGAASDVRVTGGDFAQTNGRAVQVSGFTTLRFANGTTSHGVTLPAKQIAGRLEENGADVTHRAVLQP